MTSHPNWAQSFIAFDTETTGLETEGPDASLIVTAAAVTFTNGTVAHERSWLLRVSDIPAESTAIHGVTTETSQAEGVDPSIALLEIRKVLTADDVPIVCFNAAFDIPILNANLARVGLDPLPENRSLCPLVIDRQMNPYVRGANQRRLEPTAARYGITVDQWHDAGADATVAGLIFIAEVAAYPALTKGTFDELATSIHIWRDEQDASFRAWLARQPPR